MNGLSCDYLDQWLRTSGLARQILIAERSPVVSQPNLTSDSEKTVDALVRSVAVGGIVGGIALAGTYLARPPTALPEVVAKYGNRTMMPSLATIFGTLNFGVGLSGVLPMIVVRVGTALIPLSPDLWKSAASSWLRNRALAGGTPILKLEDRSLPRAKLQLQPGWRNW
jgi:hypothetical protein